MARKLIFTLYQASDTRDISG